MKSTLHIKYQLQNLAHLMSIRSFIAFAIEGMSIKLSREQLKALQGKLTELNSLMVEKSLELDLNALKETEPTLHFESSQDVNDVMKTIVLSHSNDDLDSCEKDLKPKSNPKKKGKISRRDENYDDDIAE